MCSVMIITAYACLGTLQGHCTNIHLRMELCHIAFFCVQLHYIMQCWLWGRSSWERWNNLSSQIWWMSTTFSNCQDEEWWHPANTVCRFLEEIWHRRWQESGIKGGTLDFSQAYAQLPLSRRQAAVLWDNNTLWSIITVFKRWPIWSSKCTHQKTERAPLRHS